MRACSIESASSVAIIFSMSSACCSKPTSRRASRAEEGEERERQRERMKTERDGERE